MHEIERKSSPYSYSLRMRSLRGLDGLGETMVWTISGHISSGGHCVWWPSLAFPSPRFDSLEGPADCNRCTRGAASAGTHDGVH